ncbi:pyrin [Onychomys torridus]|uniref:pyrin n=1 Tax=Onychomys torridus TaxID=38674 RepID=UPI00167FBA07|nr:pyrin [Onychomys torridus]
MARTLGDHLLNTLEELLPYDFEKFKFKLQNTSLEKGHSRIPRGHLQMARPVKLASLLLTYYGEKYAVRLTLQILRATNQRLLAEELRKATGPEHLTEENRIGGPVQSSGENKPKSVKVPDVPEGDGTRQSGDGSDGLLPSQAEVEKGSQKKSLVKRRDPRGPESMDSQPKPWARGTAPPHRRNPGTTQSPGDKESRASAQLRRNASSAGRLQGLCSNVPGKRDCKKAEAYLPSGKKRPKSLEITTYSSQGEPPDSEGLLTPEETTDGNPHLAPSSLRIAVLNEGPTGALEKGSENPEPSMVPNEETFRNTPSKTSLTGEEKCTTSWKENGTGSPEIPGSSGKMAASTCCESCGPEEPLPLCGKPAQAPEDPASLGSTACKGILPCSRKHDAGPGGCTFSHLAQRVASDFRRSQDKAACPLCHTQKGDPHAGTCVQSFCSCSIAPGDPKAPGKCSPICSQCQRSLAGKNCGDQSPQPLPQCPRHMKQVQLLFCEDHREPICLICRLSQEHQGHRVRPMEEAALEYKEQIQKQLERLRELRGCVEKHKLQQGDKKTKNFLKQTETQQQRISCQLEKLYQFLEQQEQLFVTWLQELGQTIGKVRETYDTRISRDIALLDEIIGELEAKQDQPEWKLMQDIGVTLHRAKMVTVSEPLVTPPDVREKIHLLYQRSKFVEKSMQYFSETLRSEMETFSAVDEAKWGGHWSSRLQAQGLIPNMNLKWDGGNAQDYAIVLYPEVEAGGSEPQDYLQPQQTQGMPKLHETLSQNNKRKIRSLLKWKPSFMGRT